MRFRSRLAETEGVAENLFNAISIYVPKSLAQAQLSAESYDPTTVTADNYAVIAVTVDNYKNVLADGSALLSQWLPVFNDGTNFEVKLYIIVFDDTGFAPTVTAGASGGISGDIFGFIPDTELHYMKVEVTGAEGVSGKFSVAVEYVP